MRSLDSSKRDPVFKIGLMIVCLTLVMTAGFLLLYFKSELDVKQIGDEIGILRGQLENKVIYKPGYHLGAVADEPQQVAQGAATIEELPHKAGETVYASCHNASQETVYAWFTMGVDTGAYAYYSGMGEQIGTYMHRVPTLSQGTKMDLSNCAPLTREQFASYIKDRTTLPE